METEGDTAKTERFTLKREPVAMATELVSIVTGQFTIETESGTMVTGPVIQTPMLDTNIKSIFSEKMLNALNKESLKNSRTTTNAYSRSTLCLTNTSNQTTNVNTLQILTNTSYQPRNQKTVQSFTETSAKDVLNKPFSQSQQNPETAEMSPDALIDPDEIKKEIIDCIERSGTTELILSKDKVRNGQEIDGDTDNGRDDQNGQEPEEEKEIKSEPTDAESNLYTYEKISHLNKYVGKKPRKVYRLYKCTVCKKTFDYLLCVQNHVRIHTGDRPYKCGECPKDFVTKCSLAEHEKVHTGRVCICI
ncbi:KRAB [Mytilus coruscus]|uniref:KRAB n=1 Tax=Mytilus coruscus TaxID=42192 RepID=A0A6J8AWE8_MYTCO|nr:KRAB [Mytilus coruscus]